MKTQFKGCNKNCVIDYETRINCSDCRFKKCLALGEKLQEFIFKP